MPYLRLIRFPNLIIVAFTQYLLEFLILIPAFSAAGLSPALDIPRFLLLVCSTMLIAAGGYVINDIEDVEIDRINKPEKQIVGRLISVKSAWVYYFILFFLGFVISLYLAIHINNLPLLSIYPAAWLLLYLYSKYFKKMPLIGNVTVAVFCALVAGIVLFAERHAFMELVNMGVHFKVTAVFIFYLFFAFISTLYREIIKDLEDHQGDAENGCRTLPIVLGIKTTKVITFTVGGIFALGFYFLLKHLYYFSGNAPLGFTLVLVGMVLPLSASFYFLYNAQQKSDYKYLSRIAKFLMLSGILLLFLLK